VRRAIASVLDQSYPGRVEVVVVHDGTPVDRSVERDGPRPVRVVPNVRRPGLAGARNTGVLGLRTDYVAFCDDDDRWLPQKLERQLARALAEDRPELVTCAVSVEYRGRATRRTAGTTSVTHRDLVRSIMAMLHSSCMVFDRSVLVEGIGLVSEEIPGSQNEDWDLKLRAARRRPIAHVDEPLTVVLWGGGSHFARSWESKIRSWHWMLDRHPEIARDRRGASRVYGQIAFAEAALGHRRAALRWVVRALRAHPLQWRAAVTVPVTAGLLRSDTVLDALHRVGRGV
jgi:glycosyltransferase involved in cell wall biosynthesis